MCVCVCVCVCVQVSGNMIDKERLQLNELAVQVTQASTGGGAGGELSIAARSALQEARVSVRGGAGRMCCAV